MPFHQKKKLTSACRRIIPQGIVNEMGMSLNLRALRHVIQIRTAAGAEWEIREIFGQVYRLIKDKYPMVFYGAKERMVDGALEVYGMKTQPYEMTREQVLVDMTPEEIQEYLENCKKV
jgi:thymidylate synthase ThyX